MHFDFICCCTCYLTKMTEKEKRKKNNWKISIQQKRKEIETKWWLKVFLKRYHNEILYTTTVVVSIQTFHVFFFFYFFFRILCCSIPLLSFSWKSNSFADGASSFVKFDAVSNNTCLAMCRNYCHPTEVLLFQWVGERFRVCVCVDWVCVCVCMYTYIWTLH